MKRKALDDEIAQFGIHIEFCAAVFYLAADDKVDYLLSLTIYTYTLRGKKNFF
jgi:hypothetical protein